MTFKRPKIYNEENSWLAGRDCALHGVTAENCRFHFFARPELARSWERGKKSGEWEKTQTPNAESSGAAVEVKSGVGDKK